MSEGHASKLDESAVAQIKTLLSVGTSAREIAHMYGVTRDMVYKIRNGQRWAWVEGPHE